jgi:hypothetical protein
LCVVRPDTLKDDNNVVLFDNVVKLVSDTFNDDNNVVIFDNFDNPDTFNLLKKELPLTFNVDINVVL